MEDFEGLSDEDIQALMELGVIPDQQKSLDSQIEIAQALKDRKAPRGQTVGPSGVYVAASPLEHAAYAAQGIMAGRDMKKARLEQQSLLAKQIKGRSKYFQKMIDTPERRAAAPFMQQVELDPSLIHTPDF